MIPIFFTTWTKNDDTSPLFAKQPNPKSRLICATSSLDAVSNKSRREVREGNGDRKPTGASYRGRPAMRREF
jgi:hypothetical protein